MHQNLTEVGKASEYRQETNDNQFSIDDHFLTTTASSLSSPLPQDLVPTPPAPWLTTSESWKTSSLPETSSDIPTPPPWLLNRSLSPPIDKNTSSNIMSNSLIETPVANKSTSNPTLDSVRQGLLLQTPDVLCLH
eukprot:jgi/Bigna1/60830/fgenesh1_kg.15_\